MTNHNLNEQEIRVRIIPQLESLSDKLWDEDSVPRRLPRILDRIIAEMDLILKEKPSEPQS